ncbi:glycosyltransferase family 4 protein [Hymenobacter aerophilus]|uniref:glycosyltransferase family 4 protein n=1 Tax=Hymenobacter aerophilus TaxID=119644 RepID=UPI00035CF58E|nr:glycosyltransferase family 4 protein [Hymenobacter aerophilus]
MNILVTTFCLDKAGSHVLALALASELAKKHNVYFFNQNEQLTDQAMVAQYLSPAVQLVSMDQYPLFNKLVWKLNALGQKLGLGFSVHERVKTLFGCYLIRRHRIDVLHSHEPMVAKSRVTQLCRLTGVPTVVTDHQGYSMLIKVGEFSFVPYANLAAAVVGVSQYTADLFTGKLQETPSEEERRAGESILATDYQKEYENAKQHTPQPRQPITTRVEVIYNGVPPYVPIGPEPAPVPVPAGSFVFGMVGRGTQQKGWSDALAAYVQIKELYPDRRFAFIAMGDGAYLRSLRAEYEAAHPDIFFLGSVQTPHPYMRQCHVGLFPSWFSEAQPISIIEFFENGVPVIASPLGGIPEMVRPPDKPTAGRLLRMNSDATPHRADLVAAMQAYIDDEALLATHAQAARQLRQTYDVAHCAAQYEALFREVAQ